MTDDGADGVTEEAGRDARLWFKLLNEFVSDKMPAMSNASEDAGEAPYDSLPPRVREAYELAVVRSFQAIEAMAARFTPPGPGLIDLSRLGKDG